MPARDRSLGLGKCNTQENIIDLPPDASKKLAQQLTLALKPFWLRWLTNGKGSFRR
jgi:hypothetical protein